MIAIDARAALAELNALYARLQTTRPVLELIGARAADRARMRIERLKAGPDGEAWAPWTPSTHDSRARRDNIGQGLLWDTGTLLHSIRVQIEGSTVTIGTDVNFAEYLEDGTPRMPPRPFIGWEESERADAEMTMIDYLEGAL